jgi:SSS family solute:Na+ symporter
LINTSLFNTRGLIKEFCLHPHFLHICLHEFSRYMSLSWIDWAIVIAFLLLSLYIGLRYKDKASNSLTDFFLGGRSLPWYIAGISMVATTFAADTPLAVTEMVADSGISKNWMWWSFLIGGLLTTFFFANLWRRANVLTELELVELRYSGKPARFLRGFKAFYLGIFMNCIVIGWVNVAMTTILTVFFDLDPNTALLYTAGLMLIAVIYASLSGLLGVAITDTIQFFIAIIGCIILAVIVLNSKEVGGIENLKAALPEETFNFFPSVETADGGSGGGVKTLALSVGAFLSFIAIQWWASWYPGAEPGGGGYIAQRMMSTKNEKHSVLATLFFNIGHYCLRPWPWIVVALCAIMLYSPQHQFPDHPTAQKVEALIGDKKSDAKKAAIIKEYPELGAAFKDKDLAPILEGGVKKLDDFYLIYPQHKEEIEGNAKLKKSLKFAMSPKDGFVYAMKDYLPTGLKGLLLVAFLAAYMSTISTQVNWGSSYLVNDYYRRFAAPEDEFKDEAAAQKNYVFIGRLFTVFIMIIGLYATTLIDSISGVWEFIMECGAGLGLVLILRWYWWRINAWSEITATIAPFVGYVISKYFIEGMFEDPYTLENVYADNKGTFIFTVLFTTVAWITVTFLTAPTKKQTLIAFYDRVKPDGAWKPVRQMTNVKKSSSKLLPLIASWLGSVLMVYSILFLIGKLIFHEWVEAGISGSLAVVGFLILWFALKRTNILSDKVDLSN